MPRSLLIVIGLALLVSWAWRSHVEQAQGRTLAALARPGDIRMLSSETCPWCLAARRWMTQEGIPFKECFIERDETCLADYRAVGAAGTPTLLVRGQRIVGFDRAALTRALEASRPDSH